MIKSRVLFDETNRGINWIFVYILILCATFGKSLIIDQALIPPGKSSAISQAYASPLEIALWYPLLAISGFFMAWLLISFVKRDWLKIGEMKFYLALILAIGCGLLFSFVPLWNNTAMGMPLTLLQMGEYMLTFGIYPYSAGPDGFLRGLAWGMSAILAWLLYKDKQKISDILLIVLSSWLGISLILLLPSIILNITFVLKGLSITGLNTDFISEFTRISLFSYWADEQLLRWFTGFGNQTVNVLLLYIGSIVYACGVCLGLISNRLKYWKIFQGSFLFQFIPLLLMILYGYQAGLIRRGWVGIDWAAWLVFALFTLIVWLKISSVLKGFDEKDTFLSVFGAFGAMLLGWPILLAYFFVIAIYHFFKEGRKIFLLNETFESIESVMIYILPVFSLITALFARKGLKMDFDAITILGTSIIFAWLYGLLMTAVSKNWVKLKVIMIWLVGLLLLWILTKVFAPAAIMLLTGVILWLFWQKALSNKIIIPIIVWGTALIVLLFFIWQSKIAGPYWITA